LIGVPPSYYYYKLVQAIQKPAQFGISLKMYVAHVPQPKLKSIYKKRQQQVVRLLSFVNSLSSKNKRKCDNARFQNAI
jgi:hypothetical protein